MRTYIPENSRLIPKDAKKVFSGVIFDTYQWEQELFDGSTTTFEMVKRPDTVRVIAIRDDKVVVLEQEQPAFDSFYDLPSSRHDVSSETELEAAKRELLEETGMTFSSWKLINAEQPVLNIDWIIYTFVASNFKEIHEQNLDAGERIAVTEKTLPEIKELLKHPRTRGLAKGIFENLEDISDLLAKPGISTFETLT